jgi:hypothetical protein
MISQTPILGTLVLVFALGGAWETALLQTAWAQEPWIPSGPSGAPAKANTVRTDVRAPARAAGTETVMRDAVPVEKGDLAPVMSNDGSGLPYELWRGLDIAGIETLISELEIPPRSPALHSLWKRLITSDVTPPAGDPANLNFLALRLEALYRSGLAADAARELEKQDGVAGPVTAALASRNAFANADPAKGCAIAAKAVGLKGDVPKRTKGEAILISGYCAAATGDLPGAGLAAELAREEGVPVSPGLESLDALSIKAKPKLSAAKTFSVIDYVLMDMAGVGGELALDKAEPALLVAIANDANAKLPVRLAAAEAAARFNALPHDYLAALYASGPVPQNPDTLLAGTQTSSTQRRSELFKAAEAEKTPMKKTRLIRALIDDAKRSGIGFQAMQMLQRATAAINPQPEISWFAETAAEIGLASGDYALTRKWIALTGGQQAQVQGVQSQGLGHWLALTDIADPAEPQRGAHLADLEATAVHGRFAPDALHRLATVLDALGYNVPIPLWEAASRTPQPNTGYLPETGVLTALQDAAKKREFGRTVLLAMKAIGPNGAESAHMIALGDAIRALKRAGLEADARRLGLEALLGSWPRTAVN